MTGASGARRIAFLGVGHPHATAWVNAARATSDVDLVGASDPDPARLQRFAETHGLPALPVETVLSAGADAVIVNGRNDEFVNLATAALTADKPVLIDKPGAPTRGELADLVDLAAARYQPFHVGYFLRHARSIAVVRAALTAGSFGRVSLARIHAAMPHAAWETMGDWFADPANVGSIFQEDACHVLDVAWFLFGAPVAVTAARSRGQFAELAGEDALAAILEYPNFLVTVDFTAHEATPWVDSWLVEVFGDRLTARAGFRPDWLQWQGDAATLAATGVEGAPRQPERAGADNDAQYARAMDAFRATLAGEPLSGAPPSTGADALAVFRMIDAIARAANEGRRVELREASI